MQAVCFILEQENWPMLVVQTQGARVRGMKIAHKFRASLVYIMSSRSDKAT